MNSRLTPLAAALSVAFLAPAHAQTADLDPVIVGDPRYRDGMVAALVAIPSLSIVMAKDDIFGSQGI